MNENRKPMPGESVVLTDVPEALLFELPEADQQAISEIVGKPIRLNQYDESGRTELEFTDPDGGIHFVYVDSNLIGIA